MNWMYGLDILDFDHNLIPLPADQRDNPSQASRRHNYGQANLAENLIDLVFGVREKDRPDKRSPTILPQKQNVPS
jgi:hypothetical protein